VPESKRQKTTGLGTVTVIVIDDSTESEEDTENDEEPREEGDEWLSRRFLEGCVGEDEDEDEDEDGDGEGEGEDEE
jgi:hypothetical protein